MSNIPKHNHPLAQTIGGEGQFGRFKDKWIAKNLYRFYLSDPDYETLSGGDDTIEFKIGMAFRLVRIEWNFDDTTAKDLDVTVKHPEANNVGNPVNILHLSGNTDEEGYATYGEKYEYEDGCLVTFTANGTASKTMGLSIYIQVLGDR